MPDVDQLSNRRPKRSVRPFYGAGFGEVPVVAGLKRVQLLSRSSDRSIAQAKSWGFEEFRIMPDAGRMLAFFRKSVD